MGGTLCVESREGGQKNVKEQNDEDGKALLDQMRLLIIKQQGEIDSLRQRVTDNEKAITPGSKEAENGGMAGAAGAGAAEAGDVLPQGPDHGEQRVRKGSSLEYVDNAMVAGSHRRQQSDDQLFSEDEVVQRKSAESSFAERLAHDEEQQKTLARQFKPSAGVTPRGGRGGKRGGRGGGRGGRGGRGGGGQNGSWRKSKSSEAGAESS